MIRLLLLTEPVEPDADGSVRAPEGMRSGIGSAIEYETADELDVRLDQAIRSMKAVLRQAQVV